MATLQELQDSLARLLKARGSGVRAVTFSDGRSVTYRSDDELAAQIADTERRIAGLSATPITDIRITTSKGL